MTCKTIRYACCYILLLCISCTESERNTSGPTNSLRKGITSQGPNVVVIVLDTTRADYFSCYGYEFRSTPNIDAIAQEGTLYKNAFSTAYWTLPSHATLLSGLYPSEAGATCLTDQLPESVTTLAERLSNAGYATSAIVCNPWLSKERGFAQGFDEFLEMWSTENRPNSANLAEHDEATAPYRATSWLQSRIDQSNPFFLFINFNIPHMPYAPPLRFEQKMAHRRWAPEQVAKLRSISGEWDHLAGHRRFSREEYLIMRDLYAAEIAYVDEWVGIVVESLRQTELLDDTLLVITSDHGENLGEHGMTGHALSLFDTTIHVPLILRHPGPTRTQLVDSRLTSLISVAPMILNACGVNFDDDERLVDRFNLSETRTSESQFVIAEQAPMNTRVPWLSSKYPDFDFQPYLQPARMFRSSRYKLIWRRDHEAQVYDLLLNPQETRNIAMRNPELRDQLIADLHKAMEGIEPSQVSANEVQVSEKNLEALRALGYLK